MYFLKTILLDIDNTLYNYDLCHNYALDTTIKYIINRYNINNDQFDILHRYNKINHNLKLILGSTASSHNRTIYFKQLLSNLNIPISESLTVTNFYWTQFHSKMKLFEGVERFLQYVSSIGLKVYLLTDFTLYEQLEKIKILGINSYITNIITSEEIGCEKPNPNIYLNALNIMRVKPYETIMIGDNYEKDIIGSSNINIYGFYCVNNNKIIFNQEVTHNMNNTCSFNNFTELTNNFGEIEKNIFELSSLSKKYGERFDLVQYGGGNISIKCDNSDLMLIKSSGISLSDVNIDTGYSLINNDALVEDINNDEYNDLSKYNVITTTKPSMETYMHSFLYKYVVHLHPIVINNVLVQKNNCEQTLKLIMDDMDNYIVIDYKTPSIDLAKEIKNKWNGEEIIFLKNHGLIVTSDKLSYVKVLLKEIINRFSEHLDFHYNDYYTVSNLISSNINIYTDNINVTYFSNILSRYGKDIEETLNDYKILFPDQLIFCGEKPLLMNKLNCDDNGDFDIECAIKDYYQKHKNTPTLVYVKPFLYIVGSSINKCKAIEEILMSYIMVNDYKTENNLGLTEQNIIDLNNLSSEKYRQNLK